MLLSEGIMSEGDAQEKLLEKFDETLKSLRRQFRKLLKERKAYKNCKLLNQSEGEISVTSSKTNDSIEEPQDATEFISEHKTVSDDISMIECNNVTKNITPDCVDVPNVVKDNPPLDEEIEILSVQFDTESEQSLLKQFEQSKSNLNTKENQLQKSPVFSRNKIRGKKSFSCKIFPNFEKEKKSTTKERVTETQKSTEDNLSSNISLFSSAKEKDIFTSPIIKPSQKLGVSNIYNISPKLPTKGNKLKQTKLVFITDEEKIDISEKINMKYQEENSALDSLFDASLFNSNINVENMEVDMDDTFTSSKSTIIDTTLGSSTPKKAIKSDFEKISPAKENKGIIPENKINIYSRMNLNTYSPQATSTQFLSPNKQEIKNVHHSDSDTDFSFQEDPLLKKQSTQSMKKNLVGFIKKASVLKESSHKDYSQINKIHNNETMLDDETFFSPGEYQNEIMKSPIKPGSSRDKFTSPKSKRLPIKSFDQIPEKKKCNPEYAYDIQSVRRKNEREQLDGWSCWDCKKYYQELNLPEKELKQCLKRCSRHKAKYDPNYYTPPDFWNPAFPDTLCPTLSEQENK